MRTTKLYVGSIPSTLTEAQIAQYFKTISPQAEFKILKYSKKGKSRGSYGLVTVSSDAVSKILSMTHVVAGHQLSCEEYLSEEPFDKAEFNCLKRRRLFIRNLKRGIKEDELLEYFSHFGPVESVSIIKSHTSNKNRSFGYVTFDHEQTAHSILSKGCVIFKESTLYVHEYSKNAQKGTCYSKDQPAYNRVEASITKEHVSIPKLLSENCKPTAAHGSDVPSSGTCYSSFLRSVEFPEQSPDLKVLVKKLYISANILSEIERMHVPSNLAFHLHVRRLETSPNSR
jgi:RNA recognition motif-containing protein